MEKHLYMQEEKLHAAFLTFDKDGNGKISPEELKEILGSNSFTKHFSLTYLQRKNP